MPKGSTYKRVRCADLVPLENIRTNRAKMSKEKIKGDTELGSGLIVIAAS